MLLGVVRQGLQCRECDRVAHIKCKDSIANDCGLNALMLMRHLKQIEDSRSKNAKETSKTSKDKDDFGAFEHLYDVDKNMTDCLYKSLALTRAPDRLSMRGKQFWSLIL